ncbi:hypothetical protein [Legionella sainthelensi]|uniref:hypothetical protein n=1 Tax=Legionella sainthelensi TaxID=28087 RepID=UPI000E1FECFB|nr:hypothetical protein [Legionella sainthelensi]
MKTKNVNNTKTIPANKAALILQSCFFRNSKNHNYTGIEFDKDLKILQKAQQEEIAAGNYDTVVKRCLRYCRLRQNKFLLHKLAYTLFSGITLWPDRSKPFFQYTKILKHLLYKDIKDINLISRVVEDAYIAWKEECNHKHQTRQQTMSFDKEATLDYLRNSYQSFNKNSTQANLIKLFADSPELNEDVGLDDNVLENKNYCHKILHLLKKYLPDSSEILQSFTQITNKINNLIQKESLSEEELAELKEEIKKIWQATWRYIISAENDFGVVPLTTPPFRSHAAEITLSHGGGLFFFSQFLMGKNKGYKTDREEGGLGIYVDPYQQNYGDKYYAERAAEQHFDIPVSVSLTIEPQYLQGSNRHDDEAIWCHTNRKKATLHTVELLKYKEWEVMQKDNISIYTSDPKFFQKLCVTLFSKPDESSKPTVDECDGLVLPF